MYTSMKEMLRHASENSYAVMAINCTDMEQARAICHAAAAEHAALTALRDGLRERVIALDEENTALADEAARSVGTPAAKAALEGLTDRERSVLARVAEGLDNREVAGRLYLSEGTVRNHVSAILRKKQLHNRAQLVSLYYRGPVVTP